jgi:hypothetical protein
VGGRPHDWSFSEDWVGVHIVEHSLGVYLYTYAPRRHLNKMQAIGTGTKVYVPFSDGVPSE